VESQENATQSEVEPEVEQEPAAPEERAEEQVEGAKESLSSEASAAEEEGESAADEAASEAPPTLQEESPEEAEQAPESAGAEAEPAELEAQAEEESAAEATEDDAGDQAVAEEIAPEAVSEEVEAEAEASLEVVEEAEPEEEQPEISQEPSEELEEGEEPPPVEAAEERVEEEPDDRRHWYVVHCYSGYENKVRHNLEQRIESMGMKDRIFDVVVPTEEEIEVKDGKRRTVERRVFPGYILVQMIMDEDSWYVVRNTPGVTGFVGMGNEPTPLRQEEVAQIVKRMEAQAPRVKVTYKTGQKVRIIDGPFNDFIGSVEAIDVERAKVRVMVSFFGRETPVELDFLQVEKA
jgi:transcriptional antiterminator NusG